MLPPAVIFFPKKTHGGHGILSLPSSREGGSSREIDIPFTHPCEILPIFFFFLSLNGSFSAHKILTGRKRNFLLFTCSSWFLNRCLNNCSHWIHKFRCPEFWWKNGWLESKVGRDLTFLAFFTQRFFTLSFPSLLSSYVRMRYERWNWPFPISAFADKLFNGPTAVHTPAW